MRHRMPFPAVSLVLSSLALSLLNISSTPSDSLVFSPFSIASSLAILHDGAGGETKKEIGSLLFKECDTSEVSSYFRALNDLLSRSQNVTVKRANRLFVNAGVRIRPEFAKRVQQSYASGTENIDFSDASSAASRLNEIVSNATDGHINDLVSSDSLDSVQTLLVSTLLFGGSWDEKFYSFATRNATFHGANGDRTEPMVRNFARDRKIVLDDPLAVVLRLPYLDKSYSFNIILPRENSTLAELRASLNGSRFLSLLSRGSIETVTYSLPRFTTDSSLDIRHSLSLLGLKSAFSSAADFSPMTSESLRLSQIAHRALINVNEKGTLAAAATASASVSKVAVEPIIFIAERPFLYALVKEDGEERHLLFLGQFT